MKANLKIYAVDRHGVIANWMRGQNVTSMENADVVVFPGGADINPKIYGEERHPLTNCDDDLDRRQTIEFNQAVKLGKPMIGICRGAQLLCAKAGGILVQHQMDPNGRHNVYTYDGKIISVSSSHHQAMYPWRMKDSDYQVLGWSFDQSHFHEGQTRTHELVKNVAPLDMEVEIAFFPGIKALCIQSHPEWQFPCRDSSVGDRECITYMRELMDQFMSGNQFTESKDAYSVSSS